MNIRFAPTPFTMENLYDTKKFYQKNLKDLHPLILAGVSVFMVTLMQNLL